MCSKMSKSLFSFKKKVQAKGSKVFPRLPVSSWKDLRRKFRTAIPLLENLDRGMSCALPQIMAGDL